MPKGINTHCVHCNAHHEHKVTQYKTGKSRPNTASKRKENVKKPIIPGNAMPVFHKKSKTTKKITLKLECKECGYQQMRLLNRSKCFAIETPQTAAA